ncbi:glycosyl transferase family 39 [Frateuria sp. STR12]|uniref:glycosyl transferase family 39 n=1 Tax=Frateuria hangzhouensis TaxID=2995589 RepID=UPI002260E52F|nr:glycosyl transferase family 39 [Frateuria sp. STR12]MCX7513318.1 glycosyl transferase family 39 [Frateuria sp. STR12]
MHRLASIAFLVAGAVVFALGLGPAFFGQPLFGVPLLLVGLGLELFSWHRLRRRAGAAGSH